MITFYYCDTEEEYINNNLHLVCLPKLCLVSVADKSIMLLLTLSVLCYDIVNTVSVVSTVLLTQSVLCYGIVNTVSAVLWYR